MRYLTQQWPLIMQLVGQHLLMTGIALGISLVIALPLGVAAARLPQVRGPLLGALGVIYTIPSLSLLVLLIPLLGLGLWPAVVALVVYAQLGLVRNTVVGLLGVDAALVEAARGMGMSGWQRLWRVELPLALPVMLAGVRLATLTIIAMGTVAFLVGAGGLGRLLFEGVMTSNPEKIAIGSVAVGALALVANGALLLVERIVGDRISGVGRAPQAVQMHKEGQIDESSMV